MRKNKGRFNRHTNAIDKTIKRICSMAKKRKGVKSAYPGPISNGKKGARKLEASLMNGGMMLEIFIGGMSQKIPIYLDARSKEELDLMMNSMIIDIKSKFDLD